MDGVCVEHAQQLCPLFVRQRFRVYHVVMRVSCARRARLTCETELFEAVLPCEGAVRDTVYKRAKDGSTACFVDAEDVWALGSWGWRVVRIGFREGR